MADPYSDQLERVEAENRALKARIRSLEEELARCRPSTIPTPAPLTPPTPTSTSLSPAEYIRYGRQLILHEIGLPGQLRLKSSRVLLVGAGGLGCPAAAYLAGAGVGTLGIIDHDTVEESNLHRQILHNTPRVGLPKVHSAVEALRALNPHVNYVPHHTSLTAENAFEILPNYDIVLDCTDHPSIRYLISDVCVLLKKPLVSASALRMDGQLIVLNNPPGHGPCYRCIWPRPPPPQAVVSCGDGGILGPVVGLMGVLQALETVKIITSPPKNAEEQKGRMTIFSAYAETQFRSLRMRGRREGCIACGSNPGITKERVVGGGMEEYITFCGRPDQVRLNEENRVDVEEARKDMEAIRIDVRDETQFGITAVPGCLNVPFSRWGKGGLPKEVEEILRDEPERPITMLCRLGNDSQTTAQMVLDSDLCKGRRVVDVKGGLREWARKAPGDGVVEY